MMMTAGMTEWAGWVRLVSIIAIGSSHLGRTWESKLVHALDRFDVSDWCMAQPKSILFSIDVRKCSVNPPLCLAVDASVAIVYYSRASRFYDITIWYDALPIVYKASALVFMMSDWSISLNLIIHARAVISFLLVWTLIICDTSY